MPPKIYLLSLGSLLERSSYYGMLTVLVLYLNKAFSFSDSMSFLFYGAYTTFAFAFPVIGGYIADRFLGARHAMILGLVFLIVGNLFISFPQYYFFCIGVSCLILGTGIYKPTSTSFFGKYCQSIKLSEEKGFTIFYVAMNIGGMLGPIAYGLIAQSSKWGYSFLCSAIMLIFFW